MGQPTQRATNYTARSNIDTAQMFLHANGQRPKRAMIRQRSRRRQRRGEPHTEHGLGVLSYINTHPCMYRLHFADTSKSLCRGSLFLALCGLRCRLRPPAHIYMYTYIHMYIYIYVSLPSPAPEVAFFFARFFLLFADFAAALAATCY